MEIKRMFTDDEYAELEKNSTEMEVGNYYGSLKVSFLNGLYFWCVENYNGHHWHGISKELFQSLIKWERIRPLSDLYDKKAEIRVPEGMI